jgi:hypothetical protein
MAVCQNEPEEDMAGLSRSSWPLAPNRRLTGWRDVLGDGNRSIRIITGRVYVRWRIGGTVIGASWLADIRIVPRVTRATVESHISGRVRASAQ